MSKTWSRTLYLFYNYDLHGTIPSSLGRIPELRDLSIYVTSITGSIPSQISEAKKVERLVIGGSNLEGTIPQSISNLSKLSYLGLFENRLTGSILEDLVSLSQLRSLVLAFNNLSSSIPSSIGNLRSLEDLILFHNNLTGEIPSSIVHLSHLKWLFLSNNNFYGSIPGFLTSLSNIQAIRLHKNDLTGSISDQLCNMEYLEQNNNDRDRELFKDYFGITADCRNDIFTADVNCSCCNYCFDKSPDWAGDCEDTAIKINILHQENALSYYMHSDYLEWSLVDDTTGRKILYDGPYKKLDFDNDRESYETCISKSGCYSVVMNTAPIKNTSYTVLWNNKAFYSGTFLGYTDNEHVLQNSTKTETVLHFHYDAEEKNINFDSSLCMKIIMDCSEESITIEPNTKQQILYSISTKISGSEKVQDPSSNQSKALCWINKKFITDNDYGSLEYESFSLAFTQRYILTLLHLSNSYKIFGSDEYPPSSHECEWQAVTCRSDTYIVTEISLENNQTIDGTLLQELGSLAFLEKLNLSQSKVRGTIPPVFSNLWSLIELNLSENNIDGTIPATLFRQLHRLDNIDLSNNIITGNIPQDVGHYSHIRKMFLSKNLLTGSVPLEDFTIHGLEILDISSNELSSLNLSHILNHNNLRTLDLSDNFFVGSLHDDLFVSLDKLQYFNIARNEFSGTIPSVFPKLSKITHFDAHSNRFKGTIPVSITELFSMQHLNLQGNELTGSLPTQFSQLKNIETLVLDHNNIKGSVPLEFTTLRRMQVLRLHQNKLSGKAPELNNIMLYIADCGYPSSSESSDPLSCLSCNICCNADGLCQENTSGSINVTTITLIFTTILVGIVILCYVFKNCITSNKILKRFFSETVQEWNPLSLINDKSVYHFLLTENLAGWWVAFICAIFQSGIMFLFVHSANLFNERSDREYTMICPVNNIDECENLESKSTIGYFLFGIVLLIWLLRDLVGSFKLLLLSLQKKNIDFFFASSIIFFVTVISFWTSVVYSIAIATKNTDLIKDAVVLLFVIEIDERIFQLVEAMNPIWVEQIKKYMKNTTMYEGNVLVIHSLVKSYSESFRIKKGNITRRFQSLRRLSLSKEVKPEEEFTL